MSRGIARIVQQGSRFYRAGAGAGAGTTAEY